MQMYRKSSLTRTYLYWTLLFQLLYESVNCTINDVKCYESIEKDALPSADDPYFTPGDNPIFFLETSCKGRIDPREACAVESVARIHPNRQINLLFAAPVTADSLQRGNLWKLNKFKNIKFARIHIKKFGENTPIKTILTERLKESCNPEEHLSDILRIIVLQKFGGIYLDKDSIVVKSLDKLPSNWFAKLSPYQIGTGAIGLAKTLIGIPIINRILRELNETYTPCEWASLSLLAVQRVLQAVCPEEFKSNGFCNGFRIFPHHNFYPMPYDNKSMQEYFEGDRYHDEYRLIYMHHMWNSMTRNVTIKKYSYYDKLAWRYCPSIRRLNGDDFREATVQNN